MGTNYYAHIDCCEHCGRPEEIIHIGKQSCGWEFTFHGTDLIRSWKDWQVELNRSNAKIVDEYGRQIAFPLFKIMVEKHKGEMNHKRWCETEGDELERRHAELCWLDPEGWSFQEGEFC